MTALREAPAGAPRPLLVPASVGARRRTGALTRALGLGGLVLLVLGMADIALAAAARPSFLVPASETGFPGWLAGPLGGLASHGVGKATFAAAMVTMLVAYAAAVVGAERVPVRAALGAVVVLHVLVLLAPPLLSRDVFGYIDFARLGALHGLGPYTHGPDAAMADPAYGWVGWHYLSSPYGPLFTLGSYALAPLSVAAALWTLKAIAAAASLGIVALTWHCAQRLGRRRVRAVLLVGANPLLLVYAVGGAHNDLLLTLVAMGAVALALAGRTGAGAAGVVVAAGIKASAGLLAPFLVLSGPRRGRGLVAAVLAAVAVTAISLAAFGSHALGFLDVVGAQQHLISHHSVPNELGRALGLGGLTGGLRTVFAAALVLAVGTGLWSTWRGGDWVTAAGWATLALLICTAWLLPWYVVWLLPLAALARGRSLPIAAVALTAFVLVTRMPS